MYEYDYGLLFQQVVIHVKLQPKCQFNYPQKHTLHLPFVNIFWSDFRRRLTIFARVSREARTRWRTWLTGMTSTLCPGCSSSTSGSCESPSSVSSILTSSCCLQVSWIESFYYGLYGLIVNWVIIDVIRAVIQIFLLIHFIDGQSQCLFTRWCYRL